MPKQIWIECPACRFRELLGRSLASCPKCGGPWLDARYDYKALEGQLTDLVAARPFTMWRYWDLLPLHDPANILTMGEGGTPLLSATNLGLMLGRPNVFVKDERQGPTGSFKDRQASYGHLVHERTGNHRSGRGLHRERRDILFRLLDPRRHQAVGLPHEQRTGRQDARSCIVWIRSDQSVRERTIRQKRLLPTLLSGKDCTSTRASRVLPPRKA